MERELCICISGVILYIAVFLSERDARARSCFPLRVLTGFLLIVGACFLSELIVYLLAAGNIVRVIFLYGAAMLAAVFMRECDLNRVVFRTNLCFCALACSGQIFRVFFYGSNGGFGIWNVLIYAACGGVALVALFYLTRRQAAAVKSVEPYVFCALIAAAFVLSDVADGLSDGCLLHVSVAVMSLIIFISIGVLQVAISFARSVFREYLAAKRALNDEGRLKEEERKIIDLINIKSHDLKHILSAQFPTVRPAEKAANGCGASFEDNDETDIILNNYEDIKHTGNAALDVLLSQKSILCRKNKIEFDCMGDGSLLLFMSEIDILTMFGNIMDNAIEAASAIDDESNRIIILNIYSRNGCVVIREENYFSGEHTFKNGLPETTKKDKTNHGYGMRSIVATARRYDGTVECRTEEQKFLLKIVFPYKF